jgi:hypothetical protein
MQGENYRNALYINHMVNTSRTTFKNYRMVIGLRSCSYLEHKQMANLHLLLQKKSKTVLKKF